MKEIIKIIAKENGVAVSDVERDMRGAIAYAMLFCDDDGKQLWAQLSPNGEEPTIEEFVSFIANRVN